MEKDYLVIIRVAMKTIRLVLSNIARTEQNMVRRAEVYGMFLKIAKTDYGLPIMD